MMPNNFTITNASNIPLNVQTGTIPDVGVALLDWLQPMTFTTVFKTVVDFQLVEQFTNINFLGMIQPLQGRQLVMDAIGERAWNYIQVIAIDSPDGALITLKPEDLLTYLNIQYRVIAARNYSIYGYIELVLVQTYSNVPNSSVVP